MRKFQDKIDEDASRLTPATKLPEASRLPIPTPLAEKPVYDASKRLIDVLLSVVALIGLLPVMLLVMLLIKLDSRGPIFYRQERIGKDGKPFRMLKFRSMFSLDKDVPDELRTLNESSGPLFKMRNDPRITHVGRIIRRLSIDELPQVLNVITGEMSLVGPRPPLPRELAAYEELQLLRLRVKPGMTGAWQVSGRSRLTFEDMVRLDLDYIERRSLLLDLSLIARTIPSVLVGDGAY
jgi:lipopolysaccharide/colanic/teichoic acid biosynthesis glycosyltransferase